MLLKINRDLFYEILEYVNNLVNMRLICHDLKSILDEYGYLRKITYNLHTNFFNFIHTYDKFSNSIRTLIIDSINHPNIFLSKWPKIVTFKNCVMGSLCIVPPLDNVTEILSITDYTRSSLLTIDWNKLVKLRALYIRAWDMVLDGLEKCENLEIICINLQNTQRYIPTWIGNFSKLTTIIMNMKTNSTYHFISPKLEMCLVPKKVPFTSVSNWVPRKQLETNMYITLSGWDDNDSFVYH